MSARTPLAYLDVMPRPSRHWEGSAPRGIIVLIHGFPLGARMWEPQFALAEFGWRIVAPDLPGFGESGRIDPNPASMDTYAEDVADVIVGLGGGPAVIGGLSMGGYVAFALYRRAPALCRALVLADTRAEADTEEGRANRERLIAVARSGGAAAVADEMLPKLLGTSTLQTRPAIADGVRRLIEANHVDGMVAALRAMMMRRDARSMLPTISAPTLVIVGGEDTLTPPPLSASMSGAIPGAVLETITRAGHMPNLEQPEAFNQALAAFLHRL